MRPCGGQRGVAITLESPGASARCRTEEQCLSAQPHREAPEALLSTMRGAMSSFLSLKGLSGLFSLTEGRDLGPGFFKELGLLSTLTYPQMQGAAHWKRGQLGSVGRPKLRPPPTVSLEVFSAHRFLTSLFFNLWPVFTLLFFFLPVASLSLFPRVICMS